MTRELYKMIYLTYKNILKELVFKKFQRILLKTI